MTVSGIVGRAFGALRRGVVVPALLLASPAVLEGQQPDIPRPTGLVNDFAGVLDPLSVQRMTRIAEDVRAKSGGEMAIVTLPDLAGRDVADVALRIGREWGVGRIAAPGDRTRNAGAVILLVPKETNSDGRGRCFIATGQGTEGFITDATAGAICREATPAFMERDYAAGLELVTLLTAERFASEFGFTLDTSLAPPVREPVPVRDIDGPSPLMFLIVFIVIVMLLNNAGQRGRRGRRGRGRRRRDGCGGGIPIIIPMGGFPSGRGRGGWGGGGFGGFGGFGGGGGFAGGGGGSSW